MVAEAATAVVCNDCELLAALLVDDCVVALLLCAPVVRLGGFGGGAHDAVHGMEVIETVFDELEVAVVVWTRACVCGTQTVSEWTVKPTMSERCGNSVNCGRCGSTVVAAAAAAVEVTTGANTEVDPETAVSVEIGAGEGTSDMVAVVSATGVISVSLCLASAAASPSLLLRPSGGSTRLGSHCAGGVM